MIAARVFDVPMYDSLSHVVRSTHKLCCAFHDTMNERFDLMWASHYDIGVYKPIGPLGIDQGVLAIPCHDGSNAFEGPSCLGKAHIADIRPHRHLQMSKIVPKREV